MWFPEAAPLLGKGFALQSLSYCYRHEDDWANQNT